MSNETTTNNTATETVVEAKPTSKNESKHRGDRGEVGPHNMKGIYHSFKRREGRKARGVPLKSFAHLIAETGTEEEKEVALKWLKTKAERGCRADRERRKTEKGSLNKTIAQATKNAKRGKK